MASTQDSDRGAALGAVASQFDRLVDATADIDRFCSCTDWILPLHRTFGTGPLVVAARDDAAVALAALAGHDRRAVLCGVDVLWGYARPVVGPDPEAGVRLLASVLDEHRGAVAGVALTGVDRHGPFAAALQAGLGHRVVGTGEAVGRRVARLDDGVDAFLARRPRTFRRNLRQAARRAADAGVHYEWIVGGGPEVVHRAVRAEADTWKGREGTGLGEATFARFYLELADGLAASGRLRAGFARHRDHDVGYVLGAVRGDTYRGLQLGYAERARAWSLGNLLQLGQMQRLAAEGVTRYDLGQDMAYKVAWSDERFVTDTLLIRA